MKKKVCKLFEYIQKNLVYTILCIVLIVEVLCLFYLNFKHMYQMIDYDSSGAFVHAIEIWKQKTLFLKDYYYATTADLDSIVGIVALFFGITHDIMFSQAIGNSIVILLFLYLLYRLLKAVGIRRDVRVAIEVLLIVPYSWGQLGYVSMLFTNSACNSIRYVMPILLSSVVLSIDANEKKSSYIGRGILLLIVSFFVGLSSGLYVLLCGIFPFIIAEVVHMLFKGEWKTLKNNRLLVIVATFIICFIGYKLEGPFGLTNKANEITLMDANSFVDWVSISLIGIYQLFGGIASGEGVAFSSIEGIRIILNCAVASVGLIAVIYGIIKLVKKKADMPIYSLYALCVFLINEIALLILKTSYGGGLSEYRYHIMSAFALFILIGDFINDILNYKNVPLKQMTVVIMSFVICVCSANNTYSYYQSLKQSDTSIYKNLDKACKKYNISSLMFYGENQVTTGRIARAFLGNVNCIITGDDWRNIAPTTWGGSSAGLDNYYIGDELFILCEDGMIDTLPSYLYDNISVCENYGNVSLYAIHGNGVDLETGYSARRNTIDFPYSTGYICNEAMGNINENGDFVSNGVGGVAIQSQGQSELEGIWNVTVRYNVISYDGDSSANISVVCNAGQDIVCTKELAVDKSECVLSNVEITSDLCDVQNWIYVPEGMIIEIKDIQMELVN